MKKRVLVVDDIAFNVELGGKVIQSLMDELKIDVVIDAAYTVADALDKIKLNESYDAMIIDMNLPDGSGTTIAKAAHEKDFKTRIAALTIYPGKYENESEFFNFFLKKPIMPESYRKNLVQLMYLESYKV